MWLSAEDSQEFNKDKDQHSEQIDSEYQQGDFNGSGCLNSRHLITYIAVLNLSTGYQSLHNIVVVNYAQNMVC